MRSRKKTDADARKDSLNRVYYVAETHLDNVETRDELEVIRQALNFAERWSKGGALSQIEKAWDKFDVALRKVRA